MQYFKIIIAIFFLLCSCQSQTNSEKQDEFLYGNICLTDNIETCLAKGAIISTKVSVTNTTGFILADNSFEGVVFERSWVDFSDNNTIEFIGLCTQYRYGEREVKDNTKTIFNKTLQNLCKKYSNMQTFTIDETTENFGSSTQKEGYGYKWETVNKTIKLQYYSARVYSTSNQNMSIGLSKHFDEGNFVMLTFKKK